ncbi:MAG: GPI inositol-deacylase [Fibrobacterales bacterium]
MKTKIFCFFLIAFAFTGTFANVGTPYSGSLPRVLLFVHGNSDAMSFWRLEGSEGTVSSLKSDGIPFYVSMQYGMDVSNYTALNQNGIEFYDGQGQSQTHEMFATALKEKIENILNEYSIYGSYADWRNRYDTKIDIICHSQGGVAIRKMILDNQNDRSLSNVVNHINSIITLNSPHLGTSIVSENPVYESAKEMQGLIFGTKSINIHANTKYGEVDLCADYIPFCGGTTGGFTLSIDNKNDVLFDEYEVQFSDTDFKYDFSIEDAGESLQEKVFETRGLFGFESPIYDELNAAGFPKRPYDGSDIPFTAFYSRAGAGNMTGIIDNVFYNLSEDVDARADDFGAGEEARELLNELKASIQPTIDFIDEDWMANSDGVVDVFSQKLEGLFSPVNSKFQAIELTNEFGVIHGTSMGVDVLEDYGIVVDGPELHGADVFAALVNPARKKYHEVLELPENIQLDVSNGCKPKYSVNGLMGSNGLECYSVFGIEKRMSFTVVGVSEIEFTWENTGRYSDIYLYINGTRVMEAPNYLRTESVRLNGGVNEVEFRFESSPFVGVTKGIVDNINFRYNIVPTIITPLLLN